MTNLNPLIFLFPPPPLYVWNLQKAGGFHTCTNTSRLPWAVGGADALLKDTAPDCGADLAGGGSELISRSEVGTWEIGRGVERLLQSR